MTQDVKIAIVGTKLEELMFRAVPLIDHFLHKIFTVVHLKAEGSLITFATGVTMNLQPHTLIVAQISGLIPPNTQPEKKIRESVRIRSGQRAGRKAVCNSGYLGAGPKCSMSHILEIFWNSAINSGLPGCIPRFSSSSTAGNSFSKPDGDPEPTKWTGLSLRFP